MFKKKYFMSNELELKEGTNVKVNAYLIYKKSR